MPRRSQASCCRCGLAQATTLSRSWPGKFIRNRGHPVMVAVPTHSTIMVSLLPPGILSSLPLVVKPVLQAVLGPGGFSAFCWGQG